MPSPMSVAALAGLGVEHQLAGDAADGRIGERRDQAVQRPPIEALADVGEDQDVVAGRLDAGVQRLRLAAAADVDGVDDADVAPQHRRGAPVVPVRDHHDLQVRRG